ncbi:DUF805 domain-containing protein [Myroides sp. LJL115]
MYYLITPFVKLFDFKGKSTVNEFWFFTIFIYFVSFLLNILSNHYNLDYNLKYAFWVMVFLPYLALGFRRLNDAGINKYYFLIPGANIILACLPAKK